MAAEQPRVYPVSRPLHYSRRSRRNTAALTYLFPFGVSVLYPLDGDTVVLLVQGGHHRLVYSSWGGGRAREGTKLNNSKIQKSSPQDPPRQKCSWKFDRVAERRACFPPLEAFALPCFPRTELPASGPKIPLSDVRSAQTHVEFISALLLWLALQYCSPTADLSWANHSTLHMIKHLSKLIPRSTIYAYKIPVFYYISRHFCFPSLCSLHCYIFPLVHNHGKQQCPLFMSLMIPWVTLSRVLCLNPHQQHNPSALPQLAKTNIRWKYCIYYCFSTDY